MSITVNVELSPEAEALQQSFSRAPDEFRQAVKQGMTEALHEIAVNIRSKRLTGKGPFPVEEHRLGQVTGMLYGTTDATDAIIVSEGDFATITGSIGTPMPYAAVHEYGFSGSQSVRQHYSQ